MNGLAVWFVLFSFLLLAVAQTLPDYSIIVNREDSWFAYEPDLSFDGSGWIIVAGVATDSIVR